MQRLLREKQLDFSKHDVSERALKIFRGMDPEASVFFSNSEEEAEDEQSDDLGAEDGSRKSGSRRQHSHAGSQGRPDRGKARPSRPRNRKGLLELLMAKGLIPLAALDITRGWMVFEATTHREFDKSVLKATTQNRLSYEEIRAVLLSFHEDREQVMAHHHRPKASNFTGTEPEYEMDYEFRDKPNTQSNFMGHWEEPGEWWQEPYEGVDAQWQDEPSQHEKEVQPQPTEDNSEQSALLSQLHEEERQLQAMFSDSQRNLAQATQPVAATKKGRGWHGSAMSPSSLGQRPTSAFMMA